MCCRCDGMGHMAVKCTCRTKKDGLPINDGDHHRRNATTTRDSSNKTNHDTSEQH